LAKFAKQQEQLADMKEQQQEQLAKLEAKQQEQLTVVKSQLTNVEKQLTNTEKQQMDLVAMMGTLLEHHGLQMPQAALAPSMAASQSRRPSNASAPAALTPSPAPPPASVMLEGASSVEAPAAEPPAAEPPNSAGRGMATNFGPSSQTLSDEAATADDDGSNS